jgi:low affinity Fe/Cu permease
LVPSWNQPEHGPCLLRWAAGGDDKGLNMAKRRKTAQAKAAKAKQQLSAVALCSDQHASPQGWFTWFAHVVARLSGKPATFLIALALILVWGLSGPLFGFSDTWQLVVNTATTIVTFLMVFLIQNTQNRDTMALQIKLAELIIAMRGAHNNMAVAEELSDDDLEALHEEYRKRAEQAGESLAKRRNERPH